MVENLDTYRQRDAIIQAFSPSVTAAQKVPSLKTGHFHSPTPSDSQQITQIVSGFSVRKTIFAMILALCFIPAPGRAEAASVLQRTTELRTPPVFANCDDPGSGVQRDTHHNKEQAGGLRAAGYASPGNCGEAGPSYRASGRVLLTANAGDAQEGPSAVPPTHIGVNAGETIGWGDLAAPASLSGGEFAGGGVDGGGNMNFAGWAPLNGARVRSRHGKSPSSRSLVGKTSRTQERLCEAELRPGSTPDIQHPSFPAPGRAEAVPTVADGFHTANCDDPGRGECSQTVNR